MSSECFEDARRGTGFGIGFIVTGPSGAGKTSVIERVVGDLPHLAFSVSHTTRSPRDAEVDGRDYLFITDDAFGELARGGGFVEHTVYSGHRYGTGVEQLEQLFAAGDDVLLNVEVEGSASIRSRGLGKHPAVHIFLAPSSLDRLEERLRSRGSEAEHKIKERLQVALHEMEQLPTFDYLVINDDLDTAVEELRSIIIAERIRISGDRAS